MQQSGLKLPKKVFIGLNWPLMASVSHFDLGCIFGQKMDFVYSV